MNNMIMNFTGQETTGKATKQQLNIMTFSNYYLTNLEVKTAT